MSQVDKPPYQVPSMRKIEALEWNSYNVVSTFSGAGGSCLGYRMAGYKVRWASEFIPAAQEVYKLNHPNSILDTRDIREVQPQEILDAISLQRGDIDILDGSPPCASFSTAGKREKGWGEVKQYSDTKQRVDDLFFEYARILKGLQPKVFVAENVSGLVKGTAKGYFKEILQALRDCGYNVKARLLDARWLGVPQMRQRLIFIGVRHDLKLTPIHPEPLPYYYTVRDALPSIALHGTVPPHKNWVESNRNVDSTLVSSSIYPSPTILQSGENKGVGYVVEDTGGQWGKGNITDRPAPTIRASGVGHLQVVFDNPIEPETDISRYAIGDEWDKLKVGERSSKYFQLSKADPNKPYPTVTNLARGDFSPSAAISSLVGTHPYEKRKLSIAELKRICAFPDDFQLTGTYAQQWERLGRSVPPVMMMHIAKTIQEQILDKL